MDEKIEFKSLKELYRRVLPALYSKSKELHALGFVYVNEKDIWNYLVDKSWKDRKDLELHEIISDIIHLDNYEISRHVMDKLNNLKEHSQEKISSINTLK